MELKEILEEVPGITRRFVHYLESRGYIQPEKIRKQRIARRDYSAADLEIIKGVWRYYDRGYSLQSAYDLATATDRSITYLGISVPDHATELVIERLKDYPEVVMASVVHGGELNLILKTDTADQSDVYHTLVPILAEMGITGLPDIYVTEERYVNADSEGEQVEMMAYVQMRVPGKDVGEVMEKLKTFEAIKEASTVYGESDVIARIEVANQEELDTLVMKHIHDIPAVESTRTFVVVKNLHWSRQ